MADDRKKELIQMIADVEYYPVEFRDDDSLNEYQTISFDGLASLGSIFAQLPKSFRTISSTVNGGQQLYALDMRGLVGKLSSLGGDGVHMLTGVYDKTGLIGNAVYKKVPTSVASTMPINPAMLFMGIALMGIEKKLGNIEKAQKQIMSFLEQKNESELLGNLKFLHDVLNDYKYNYDNDRYKSNMHIKALDIKQTSEQNILFYKKQISELINKKSLVHLDQQTDMLLTEIQRKFRYFKLSVYQYAFSSFVELILLENFGHDYLKSVSKKIKDYSLEYKEFYTECYDKLEHNANTSVQTILLKGLSKATKSAGEAATKVPVIKKSQLNEGLLSGSEKLKALGNKKTENTMNIFIENRADEVNVFVENIENVDRIYNNSVLLLFDDKNIYLKCNEAI